MITLFTDIDNTMIYSHRRLESVDGMRCVEIYNNKPLSYMLPDSYNKLESLNNSGVVQVIPITTRVNYQFNRISLPSFKYSLLYNGAMLYINGERDSSWEAESRKYAEKAFAELTLAYKLLEYESFIKVDDIRFPENLFVLCKSDSASAVKCYLEKHLDLNTVIILTQGRKVYILPKEFNKGFAIKRFKERLNCGKCISAGDEVLDFPMKDYTDVFITSNDKCIGDNVVHSQNKVFSDEVLSYVEHLLG